MAAINDVTRTGAIIADAFANGAGTTAALDESIMRGAGPLLADTAAQQAVDRAEQLRVLIYSTDMGGGHDAMANAIKGELLLRYPGQVSVEVANGLQIGNPIAHRLMRDTYALQLRYAPGIYGATYGLASNPTFARVNEAASRWVTGSRLAADIARRDPDVIMSTFPQLTGIVGRLRSEGRVNVPAYGVIIDSDPHRQWTSSRVTDHLVLNPADVPRIARFGAADAPITGRAIRPPVDPRSFEAYDVAAARAEFGLPREGKVLLVSGGSWGLALPEAELRRILAETDLHLAIATGRNEEAFNHLKATFPANRVTPIVFTREMPKLLAASDGMLTNSAGMTTMEGFARGRPIVLYRPIVGHGVDGAKALDEDGLATFATTPEGAVDALRRIERGDDPELLARAARAQALFDEGGDRVSDIVMDAARSSRQQRGTAST